MSHFTVMVIGAEPEKQLAPFDVNLDVPRYVKYTKQQLIEKAKKEIEEYKHGTYAQYLSDKEAYKRGVSNMGHIEYLENEFPSKLKWTDEEIYSDEIGYYGKDEIGPDGEVYSERNPNSKWDWYQIGGRWAGSIKLKEGIKANDTPNFSWGWDSEEKLEVLQKGLCDFAIKKDIANLNELSTFALLKDGKWYERGSMGWWGCVSDEKTKEEWDSEFKNLIRDLPEDTLISIYDCHI